jgi:hypothetical protein
LIALVREHSPRLHRAQVPNLRWEFLTLSLPLQPEAAVKEAVIFFVMCCVPCMTHADISMMQALMNWALRDCGNSHCAMPD